MKKFLALILLVLVSANLYALTNDEEVVNLEIDINFKDPVDGSTVLMFASYRGDIEMVRELIEARADVNIQDRWGNTALTYAAQYGYIEVVRELIKARANVSIQDNESKTALDYAKEKGHNDIIELLEKEKGKLK